MVLYVRGNRGIYYYCRGGKMKHEPFGKTDIFWIIIITLYVLVVSVVCILFFRDEINMSLCPDMNSTDCRQPRYSPTRECRRFCYPNDYYYSDGGFFSANNCVCREP